MATMPKRKIAGVVPADHEKAGIFETQTLKQNAIGFELLCVRLEPIRAFFETDTYFCTEEKIHILKQQKNIAYSDEFCYNALIRMRYADFIWKRSLWG